jgi:hypothetical protein
LEVLFSIFVLAVGLLGLMALLPVGRWSIAGASRYDRSSATGRAAFRDVQVRGMLRPQMWLNTDIADDTPPGSTWADYTLSVNDQAWIDVDTLDATNQQLVTPLQYGNSICIDPLFVARNITGPAQLGNTPTVDPARGSTFPLALDNDPASGSTQQGTPPRMIRTTLRSWSSPGSVAMPAALAARIFTMQDDLQYFAPDDEELRPMMRYDWYDQPGAGGIGDGFADDFPSTGNPLRLRPQRTGEFTWLITVTPEVGAIQPSPGTSALQPLQTPTGVLPQTPFQMASRYTVSVVVFHNRNFEPAPFDREQRIDAPPAERMVYADFINGIGLAGGDVRLRWVDDDDSSSTPPPSLSTDESLSDAPSVRPGQWLMLCGWVVDRTGQPPGTAGDPVMRSVFRWYRIVAAERDPIYDSQGNGEWIRNVTLVGPDWQSVDSTGALTFNETVIDSSGPVVMDVDADDDIDTGHTVYAALFDNVVGVYQKTLTIDSWSSWSQ